MVAWKNVGWIAIVIGLVACREAAAREPISRPAEVLAIVSLGPDHTLDNLRGLANAIKPGTSAELTEPKLRALMAQSIGAPSLDGLNLFVGSGTTSTTGYLVKFYDSAVGSPIGGL